MRVILIRGHHRAQLENQLRRVRHPHAAVCCLSPPSPARAAAHTHARLVRWSSMKCRDAQPFSQLPGVLSGGVRLVGSGVCSRVAPGCCSLSLRKLCRSTTLPDGRQLAPSELWFAPHRWAARSVSSSQVRPTAQPATRSLDVSAFVQRTAQVSRLLFPGWRQETGAAEISATATSTAGRSNSSSRAGMT